MKAVFYTTEHVDNDLVRTLVQVCESWAATTGNRPSWPLYFGQRVRRDENGIGLELDHLPMAVPSLYADVPLVIAITEDYLDGSPLMKMGQYKRGRTTAIVTKRTQRPSDGRAPYCIWKIEIRGTSLNSVNKMYSDIRAGKIEPKVYWQTDDKQ